MIEENKDGAKEVAPIEPESLDNQASLDDTLQMKTPIRENTLSKPLITSGQTSLTLNNLFAALSFAQGDLSNAIKNKANPFFNSKYADIASILDAIREPFSKNGLAITQLIKLNEGLTTVVTILGHRSGEYIVSECPIIVEKRTAQGSGSAITYARRYALAAICGIAQEDNDANLASTPAKPTLHKDTDEFSSAVANYKKTGDLTETRLSFVVPAKIAQLIIKTSKGELPQEDSEKSKSDKPKK